MTPRSALAQPTVFGTPRGYMVPPMRPSVLTICAGCWRAWVLRNAYGAAMTRSGRAAWRRRSNLKRAGANAKPYRVKQVRVAVLKARLGFKQ
jgi:hypothetical protein